MGIGSFLLLFIKFIKLIKYKLSRAGFKDMITKKERKKYCAQISEHAQTANPGIFFFIIFHIKPFDCMDAYSSCCNSIDTH